MADVLSAIGLISGVLGIIDFFKGNIPGNDPQGAKVQIKVGLADDNVYGQGGNYLAAYAWDNVNNYLGSSGGGTIGDGGIAEVTIDQQVAGAQADFVGLTVGKDEMCIAGITVNQYGGSGSSIWTGNVGAHCGGGPNYVSNQVAGKDPNSGNDYRPLCVWFDTDHDNDRPNAAVKFRSRSYGSDSERTLSNDGGCGATIYDAKPGAINAEPGQKRAIKERSAWLDKRLIVSNITDPHHTAQYLCTAPTTYGPDFVGTDGMYCDMATKTLIPLCVTKSVEGCIDLDTESKAVTKRSSVGRRSVNLTHRQYEKVEHWS